MRQLAYSYGIQLIWLCRAGGSEPALERMRPVPGTEVWPATWDFRLYRRQLRGRSVGVIKGVIRLRVSSILRSGSRHGARDGTGDGSPA